MRPMEDAELIQRFTRLVKSERRLTHLILQDLVEIERRRLCLDNYPSMFEFLTRGHGYSASAALRRLVPSVGLFKANARDRTLV